MCYTLKNSMEIGQNFRLLHLAFGILRCASVSVSVYIYVLRSAVCVMLVSVLHTSTAPGVLYPAKSCWDMLPRGDFE